MECEYCDSTGEFGETMEGDPCPYCGGTGWLNIFTNDFEEDEE